MKSRTEALKTAREVEFDLAVVGGGIVGAGAAQDAAASGLSVIVLEKGDFASGTSSRTTKCIHGGFRYVGMFLFRLVRELCQERGLLEQLAPHMVKDSSFILPVRRGRKLFGLKVGIGLRIYDYLSTNARGVRRHERLNKRKTMAACPSLDPAVVASGLRFHDCITDDSRVVMAVLKSATDFGALPINYLEAVGFQEQDGRVSAVVCRDRLTGEEIVVRCRSCVNATGVWSDEFLQKLAPVWKSRVKPAKGTHVILPASSFKTSTALFLPTEDGRFVFVVPWQHALMVGTTDLAYEGPLDNPVATTAEIDYLLSVLNSYRKPDDDEKPELTRADVIASWAGLRPLVAPEKGEAGGTGNLSREHLLFEGPLGVIGLIGGKLTNYRMLSVHVVDMVLAKLQKQDAHYAEVVRGKTATIMLGGWADKVDYISSMSEIEAYAEELGLEEATAEHLIANYGREAFSVLDIVKALPALAEKISPDFPAILAEAAYGVSSEMAVTLEDILSRRIRLGFVQQRQALEAAPRVAQTLVDVALWDEVKAAGEVAAFTQSMQAQLAPLEALAS